MPAIKIYAYDKNSRINQMERIQDYLLLEKIAETRGSIVCRGRQEKSKNTVIIKSLKAKFPTPSEIARFRQEYELIKSLDLEGVVKTFDIISHDEGFALILEDFDGVSIKSLLDKKKRFDIKSFLKISAKIAETLGSLHEKGIAHRDIKPHNILINPKTGAVKITDFGISALLTHENDEVYNPDFIVGTLAYMSPEQTGRMNRTVDYRTDLYSFGVTLYEILTGKLPFRYHDPMELIHSHIAVMPESPAVLDPGIPGIISEIIMRLLSKTPEERYQNAFGVMADVNECLRQLAEKKKIEAFELARHDISNRFIIPQKLFGREKEINILLESFEDVTETTKGAAVMVVTGAPGIGKSALVNEIHKPIVAKRGYFISGKYEQFRRDKPYSGIIQAFQVLVRQILTESEEKIGIWKRDLLNALRAGGKIITEVIPEVELIIGKQPELPVLGPEESKNRFNFVFEKFTSVFPAKEHPVALFLDDLQWADLASLQLMRNILTSADIRHLLLIVSYRNNEADDSHPVMEFLREAEKKNVPVERVTLGPLTKKDVKNLITNFLRCPEEQGSGLAELVRKKTGGNPFFVNQFLHTLYNEKMIALDGALGWRWDMVEINRMQVTDNLVEMMAGKIGKLSGNTRDALKICACIGNRFDLETLALVRDTSIDQALHDLTEAINNGLVSLLGDIYVFHHDRIQEAAYSLVSDIEKLQLHYRIGKLALDTVAENELQNKLFYIVDQLNLGSKMITGDKEREELTRFNFEAGKKAMASAAYAPAFSYLKSGIGLLEKNPWVKQYDLTLALYTESVEAAYLMGDFNAMNELADSALQHARTTLDKVKIFLSTINACIAREDLRGAIDAALPVLRLLGIRMPKKPSQLDMGPSLAQVKLLLLGKSPEYLLNRPRMTDAKKLATMQILASIVIAAFFIDPNMLALAILKMLLLTKHGNAPDHAFAYAFYGVILAVGLWDFKGAVEYAHLGLKLVDKLDARAQQCRTMSVYNTLIRHWIEPLKNTITPLMEGYQIGLETGDLTYATLSIFISDVHSLFSCMELSELECAMAKHNQIIAGLKQEHVLKLQSLTWQAVLNLLGQCDDPLKLTGKAIDGEKYLPLWESANNRGALSVFWFIKLILYTVFNEHSLAIKASDEFKKYKESQQGIVVNLYAVLCDSVARLFLYPKASLFRKIKYRVQVGINQMKMKKWADNAPMNCLHMFSAVNFLCTWLVQGKMDRAENILESTILLCKKHGDIIVEGVAHDIIIRFYRSIENEKKAREHMAAAYTCYSRWGAAGPLNKMIKMHPEMAKSAARDSRDTISDTSSTISGTLAVALDLSTVMKASQAISGEIMLGKLLGRMMKIVIENAGAEKGFMILENRGGLLVEAEGSMSSENISVLESIPVESHPGLSASIVNYVARTKGTLILNDATSEGGFIDDPYVVKNKPKSVLCSAILNQGRLSGILYLENNLATGAFTTERLEILNILSSQIAISIDNAKLYENLEDKVTERTEELQKTMEELREALDELEVTNNNLTRVNRELEKANVQYQVDMELAGNVQTAFFPPEPPQSEDYDIAFKFKPMTEISGDFYDFYQIGDRIDGVGVFDVSGHGISSGLLTLLARSIISRNFDLNVERFGMIMENINKELIDEISQVGLYITGILLRFKDGMVEYTNSGHPDLLYKSVKKRTVEKVISSEGESFVGPFLGIELLEEKFKSIKMEFNKGDCLLAYTDSLSETRNQQDEQYDEKRIIKSLQDAPDGTAREMLNYIMDQFYNFTKKRDDLRDDLTAILIKKK
jgi:predicted ATPase/serine phosphatase RsbU (regulator of sigma subunit)